MRPLRWGPVAPFKTLTGLTCDASGVYVAGADGQVLWLAYMVKPNVYAVHAIGEPVQTFCGLLPDEVTRARLSLPRVAKQRLVARNVARLWDAYRSRALPITMGPSRADVRQAWFEHWRLWRAETS